MDLVIISPTVEAGISFDVKNYFDKCYSILSNESTSGRAYFQMLSRVRHFKSDVINTYIGNLAHSNELLYFYDEIKDASYKGLEETPLINTLIHNELEIKNSHANILKVILDIIAKKQHEYEYVKYEKKKDDTKFKFSCLELFESSKLNEDEFMKIKQMKFNNEEVTRAQNLAYIRYTYINKLHPEKDTLEFFENHYMKLDIFKNYKNIHKAVEDRNIKEDNHLRRIYYEKIDIIKPILKELESVDDKDKFNDIVNKYSSQKDFRIKFDQQREPKKQNLLKFINEILNNYGYEVTKKQKTIKVDKKFKKANIYKCDEMNIIKQFNERTKNKAVEAPQLE
jgi:hypothetical protein